MRNDWLEGYGPLFVLVPKEFFQLWRGVNSLDYDFACLISDDSVHSINIGGRESFILGGGDSLTLLAEKDNKQNVIIIRWIAADREDDLIQMAKSGRMGRQLDADIIFDNTCREWIIADATLDLSEVGVELREIALPVGNLRVNTQYIDDESLSYLVHNFFAT
ncbi:Imm21 family immunity protein [Planctomicrobium sp. SH527]|uniref:Imm21 family immunity protein n=1 Tax=Planctomicrobium sp. SH527 TaxID=3448123 RepID=UPI003F5B825B